MRSLRHCCCRETLKDGSRLVCQVAFPGCSCHHQREVSTPHEPSCSDKESNHTVSSAFVFICYG